jgi:hypothetical protein
MPVGVYAPIDQNSSHFKAEALFLSECPSVILRNHQKALRGAGFMPKQLVGASDLAWAKSSRNKTGKSKDSPAPTNGAKKRNSSKGEWKFSPLGLSSSRMVMARKKLRL